MREKSALANALGGNCPRCGAHSLFGGWVRFAHKCPNCALDYDSFNVGDGPAAFGTMMSSRFQAQKTPLPMAPGRP